MEKSAKELDFMQAKLRDNKSTRTIDLIILLQNIQQTAPSIIAWCVLHQFKNSFLRIQSHIYCNLKSNSFFSCKIPSVHNASL
jgi:hypothetical protein